MDLETPKAPEPTTEGGSRDRPAVSSIDVIIELYKRDVDRTLIIEQLRKTPAQRAEDLQNLYDFAMEMRRAVSGTK